MQANKSGRSIASSSPTRDRIEKEPGTPSPKKKKVFTVARSVPSTPTLDLSGANDSLLPLGKPSMSKGEVKMVLNKQIRRDNNGKIMTHAALGTQDDVEQFDEYLQSVATTSNSALKSPGGKNPSLRSLKRVASRFMTKGQSTRNMTASDTIGTTTLPRMSLDSPHLPALPPESQATQPPNVGSSPGNNSKQALKEYKKMLRAMPIHERISMEREKNVLLIWETRNREWEKFRAKMSKKLNKPETDLVMVKASEYRQQMEEYDLINKATPQEEKHGNDYWSVSLRDEGTRFVPVGNVFSGLFCPVREDKNPITETIRRPMENRQDKAKPNERHQGKFNEALLARKRQLRRNIQHIQPHHIDSDHCDGLKVESTELFEWAARSSQQHYDHLLQDEQAQQSTERERRADDTRPSGALSSRSNHDVPTNYRDGPCFQFVHPTTGDAVDDLLMHVSFHAKIGAVHTQDVLVRNPGPLAMHFTWSQYPLSHRDFAVDTGRPRTFVSQLTGVLAPHMTSRFTFGFSSATPGLFLEMWKLTIDPYLAEHNNDPRYAVERTIHMSCAAVDHRAPFKARKAIMADVDTRSTSYMLESLLRDILANVEYPTVLLRNEDDERKRDTFEAANCQLGVHYSSELYGAMVALYDHAQNLILADKQAKLVQVDGGGAINPPHDKSPCQEESHDIPPEGIIPVWDGLLPTLLTAATSADEIAKANFKALTPRKEASDDEGDEDEPDNNDESGDDDGDTSDVTPRAKKTVFQPSFRLAYEELRHLALFRPHSSDLLRDKLAANLAFLCSEIPVMGGIFQLDEDVPDVHDALCMAASAFIRQAVDASVESVFEAEKNLAIAHVQRKHVWIPDKLTFPSGLLPSPSSHVASTNVVLHVDLDVSHCFVLGPRQLNVAPPPNGDGGTITPVPSEWKWMDGIESFTPSKIAHVATILQTLIDTYTSRFEAAASSARNPTTTIQVLLISNMTTPRRGKAKKKSPPLLSPVTPVPSMAHVAHKLETVCGQLVHFEPTVEAMMALSRPSNHALDKGDPGTTLPLDESALSTDVPKEGSPRKPSLVFQFHLAEALPLLHHPPPPELPVEAAPPVDDKPAKDDGKKDKKKTAGPKKDKDDDGSPKGVVHATTAVVSARRASNLHALSYESSEARRHAVWTGTYADAVSDALSGWADVVVSDTFGSEDEWATVGALRPGRQLLGPRLGDECARVGRFMQPHQDLVLRHHSDGGSCRVVLGGRTFSDKLWLLDGIMDVADEVYFCGGVALSICRYFHLPKEARATVAGVLGFEVEPAMSHRVMEMLRSKAARNLVKLYVPFDWCVGDSPLDGGGGDDDEGGRGSPSTSAPAAASSAEAFGDDGGGDNGDDDDDDDDECDEEGDEDDTTKKSKIKAVAMATVVAVEPLPTSDPASVETYDGIVMHVAYAGADAVADWLCVDDLTPGCLSRFLCRTKSDGMTLPTPHEWVHRAFDTGPLSMQALVARVAPTRRLVVAGLPGVVEYAEFQSSARSLAALVGRQQEDACPPLVVGSKTQEWMQRLASDGFRASRNASVLKYLVAGQPHPAVLAISSIHETHDVSVAATESQISGPKETSETAAEE
ncbi:hypothetical protein, variant [Aphanomyces astaci]|uniref:phosphoglycerate kinase n=1 Tax=Aphanomyces astaci TaxID=112090 RepID=W4GN83_APHAT|nr:hypothetical protein, variant [Aphanomyces astaci]ETV80358.1 hypothetical protein, variant [Aphanomyces astaci]|eukprot:XP_009830282.1 hypothetical protein, variant [Aphanomyces astaci]